MTSIYASNWGSAALTSTGVFCRWGYGSFGANGNGMNGVDLLTPGTPSLPAGTVVATSYLTTYMVIRTS